VTLVSVCIPTRNQSRFLSAAIGSALAQDVDDLEVLVHDDASDDATAAVLARCTDPRVRVLRHDRPLGVAANRNSLLDRARGRYIAWLDSDDVYLPRSLGRRLSVLE
jgi:glycosyltransferase involved in cell wall biosynthesis